MTASRVRWRAALVVSSLLLALAVLTWLVAARDAPLLAIDAHGVSLLHGAVVHTAWLTFFQVVAIVGQPWSVRAVCLVIAVVLWVRRLRRLAVWIAAVLVVNAAAWIVLKQLVQRPRPDLLHQIAGWSYPSGHASEIAAGMGILVVLTSRYVERRWLRRALIALWLLLVGLVGVDRVFLAAHNPSDVVGGWLVGLTVVVASRMVFGIGAPPVTTAEHPLSTLTQRTRSAAVILNPVKVGNVAGFQARVNRAARAAGWNEPQWFETTSADPGGSMAQAAVAAKVDLVMVAGGDGTVRVVCAELAGTGVPVGIIPLGTGNLLARNLGLPLMHDQAIDIALRGQDRAVDVVRIVGDGLSPTRFVVMAGLGLDAVIMDRVPDALKARLGWPAYLLAAARLLRHPVVRVEVSIDGREPFRRTVRTVVVGNVGSLQAGIPLMPDARIDDGVLDVVMIAPRRLTGWVGIVLRVVTKHRATNERLDRYTGRSVSITAAHPTARQLDGDPVPPGLRLGAEIEPGRLLVRVPR